MFSFLTGVDVMHLRKLGPIIIILIFSSFLIAEVSAEEIENKADANIDIDLETATDLKISIAAEVSKITLSALGTSYTSEEIASIANTNPTRMSVIQYALKDMLKNQIERTFESAMVVVTDELPTYENDVFYDEFSVELTTSFFNTNDTINIHDFVNGVLDMGAVVSYNFDFYAEDGWNNTYAMTLPFRSTLDPD